MCAYQKIHTHQKIHSRTLRIRTERISSYSLTQKSTRRPLPTNYILSTNLSISTNQFLRPKPQHSVPLPI